MTAQSDKLAYGSLGPDCCRPKTQRVTEVLAWAGPLVVVTGSGAHRVVVPADAYLNPAKRTIPAKICERAGLKFTICAS